jgi:hypothetical protein
MGWPVTVATLADAMDPAKLEVWAPANRAAGSPAQRTGSRSSPNQTSPASSTAAS